MITDEAVASDWSPWWNARVHRFKSHPEGAYGFYSVYSGHFFRGSLIRIHQQNIYFIFRRSMARATTRTGRRRTNARHCLDALQYAHAARHISPTLGMVVNYQVFSFTHLTYFARPFLPLLPGYFPAKAFASLNSLWFIVAAETTSGNVRFSNSKTWQ